MYKVLVTLYTLAWLTVSVVAYATQTIELEHNWFYYLSNQVYVLIVAYYITSTSLLVYTYYQHVRLVRVRDVIKKMNSAGKSSQQPATLRQMVNQWSSELNGETKSTAPPKCILIVLWMLYTIVVPLTYTVTLQWLSNASMPTHSWLSTAIFVNFNILNSVLITIEFLVSLVPIRVYHFYLPVLYACFNCLVVYVVWVAWPKARLNQPTFEVFNGEVFTMLSFLGYLGFILAVHVVHAISYRLKLWLYYDILVPKFERKHSHKLDELEEGVEDVVYNRNSIQPPLNSIQSLANSTIINANTNEN